MAFGLLILAVILLHNYLPIWLLIVGGIIFYIGAVIWWISSNFSYPYFFIGLSIITVISFIDDIYNLTPKNRLTFQFLSMLLMVVQLLVSTNVIVRDGSLFIILGLVLFALFVCTGAINVFNFMDGINGITGGYSLIVLLSLAYQYHQLQEVEFRKAQHFLC